MNKMLFVLIVIFLPIFTLLQIVDSSVFNLNFYEKKYEQYNIEDVTGKNSDELIIITEDLLNYLHQRDLELKNKDEYSNRDIIHLVDVKDLFQKGFLIKRLSFIISITAMIALYSQNTKNLYKSTYYSSIISLAIILFLLLFSYLNFDKLFTYFHLVLFDNDYWILDPEKDLLIQLFPEGFFIDIFSKIALLFIGIMSIILIISYLLKERKKGGECI